eukprot:246964-Amphidinium_carterae.2
MARVCCALLAHEFENLYTVILVKPKRYMNHDEMIHDHSKICHTCGRGKIQLCPHNFAHIESTRAKGSGSSATAWLKLRVQKCVHLRQCLALPCHTPRLYFRLGLVLVGWLNPTTPDLVILFRLTALPPAQTHWILAFPTASTTIPWTFFDPWHS